LGGGILASLVSYTHVFGLDPSTAGIGPVAPIFGWLVALAVLMGNMEFLLFFMIRIKVKYLVMIYVLIDLATVLKVDNAFGALLHLCGGLSGYLYLRYAPRRGYGFSFSERYYALRNEYYRSKRRKAAKKFEVYMRKQNREVHFDSNGRYVDPDAKDPNDKRWMN
jgi:membrane associated rhomboid family serine protease